MSVQPIDPTSPDRARRLLSGAAAGDQPQSLSLGVLDLVGILAREQSARDRQIQIRVAALNAEDAQARTQIRALNPSDATTHQIAVQDAAVLLDAWRDGAVLGVHDFHSRLVGDQTLIWPALAGNLLWAASAINGIEHLTVLAMSFFGATLGTLGAIPPRYDAVIGPVTADVVARLNNLHDDLLNRLDLFVFPLLRRRGYPSFAVLDRPDQLAVLWSGLFRVPATGGHYIEPTRVWVRARLDAADAAAAAHLAALRRAWVASIRPDGVDIMGSRFKWDRARWNQLTTDPVWLLAGRDISFFEVYYTPNGDPPFTDIPARAAALLRLSIDSQFSNLP